MIAVLVRQCYTRGGIQSQMRSELSKKVSTFVASVSV